MTRHTFTGDFTEQEKMKIDEYINPLSRWDFWHYKNSGFHCFNNQWEAKDTRVYGSTIEDMIKHIWERRLI